MKKLSTWDKVRALEAVGFRYHAYGTLTTDSKDEGKLKYDFYKGDKLTQEQKEKLKNKFGESVRFFGSSAQYAPEIKSAIVGFLISKKPASKTKANPHRKYRTRRNKGSTRRRRTTSRYSRSRRMR